MRLSLIAALLCGILGSSIGIKAQGAAADSPHEEEQLRCNDGWQLHMAEEPQGPLGTVMRSSPSSHRIASNRPIRLRPTHGGKPDHQYGRWAKTKPFHFSKYTSLYLLRSHVGFLAGAASQRLYYVIALRRLLC